MPVRGSQRRSIPRAGHSARNHQEDPTLPAIRVEIVAVDLREGDKLIGAELADIGSEIFLATRRGKAIRFPEESELRPMGRTAAGVRACGSMGRRTKWWDGRPG